MDSLQMNQITIIYSLQLLKEAAKDSHIILTLEGTIDFLEEFDKATAYDFSKDDLQKLIKKLISERASNEY